MSRKKSEIGNNPAFNLGSSNPLGRYKKTNGKKKAEDNKGTFFMKGEKVFVIVDEKGVHLINEEYFLKPENFITREPYPNVLLFIKQGLPCSDQDINKALLEAQR